MGDGGRGREGMGWCASVCVVLGGSGGVLFALNDHRVCSIWTCLAFTLTTGLNAYRALILAVSLCSLSTWKSFKAFHIRLARRSQHRYSAHSTWSLLSPVPICQLKKKCPCFDRAPYFCVRWSVAFSVVIRLSMLKMLQSDAGAVLMLMRRTDLFQFYMSLVFIISTWCHKSIDLFIHFNSWLGFSRNGFIRIRFLNHLMLFLHGWFHGWMDEGCMDGWRMHGWCDGWIDYNKYHQGNKWQAWWQTVVRMTTRIIISDSLKVSNIIMV